MITSLYRLQYHSGGGTKHAHESIIILTRRKYALLAMLTSERVGIRGRFRRTALISFQAVV